MLPVRCLREAMARRTEAIGVRVDSLIGIVYVRYSMHHRIAFGQIYSRMTVRRF